MQHTSATTMHPPAATAPPLTTAIASPYPTPPPLSQVFSQLEESNLFLIQNGQEAEEELEELRAKMRDTR
jgi:hypothetical protein